MGAKLRFFATAAALFALTACGGTGDSADGGDEVASLNSGEQQPSGQNEQANAGTDEDRMRAFAKCMRDNGVDMEDPKPGGGVAMRAAGPDDAGKMQKAHEACKSLLPNGGEPKPLSPEELDKARQTAKCMREHGIDMPDPNPDNPGMTLGLPGGDDQSKMEKAMKECGMGEGRIAVNGGGK
jgi:hypothetical protein